jgi:hypothetical protein
MEFAEFKKMARLSRECFVTEKIDGTNAQIFIGENGEFLTGSRTRWITPQDDNFGFSKWAHENKEELMNLGTGRHFGEWWGQGIQRKYGMDRKVFSLFNVSRWESERPSCCSIVPILWRGNFCDLNANEIMQELKQHGSFARKGFMNPEGIVVYHVAGKVGFKKTFEKDNTGKWDK